MAWSKRVVKSRSRKMSGRKRMRSINSRRKLIGGTSCSKHGAHEENRLGGGGCGKNHGAYEEPHRGGRRRVKRRKRSIKRKKNRHN